MKEASNASDGRVRVGALWCRLILVSATAAGLLWGCQSGPGGPASAKASSGPTSAAPPAPATVNVIPAPAHVTAGEGAFAVTAGTRVIAVRDPDTVRVASYFIDLLKQTRAVGLAAPAGAVPALYGAERAIVFRLDPGAADSNPESYQLDVTPQRIIASARGPRGLFYAAVTLWQFCTVQGDAIRIPSIHIVDSPRFPWRGLMLDSARSYQSPEFILSYIDWMALHKLNVLHWHLTDDQGWRLEIKRYPRLTEVGAWRVPAGRGPARNIDPATGRPRLYGGYYSQETVRRIVAHAAARNVTIVPEIDMPGHATAAIVAYPHLGVTDDRPTAEPSAGSPTGPSSGSSPGRSAVPSALPSAVPADWGVYLNLYNVEDSTFEFLQNVLDEVMTLFPSKYIHVGGDEAAKDQWKASARVQARMRELGVPNEEALQSYFIRRMEKYLDAHGRRLIGWDEILEGSVAENATVMSWRGTDGALAAAKAGHDTVLSAAPVLYFDNRQGSGSGEPPGRGRIITLEDVYHFDPLPPSLSQDERRHVLGLQGNLWTEHIRTEDRAAYMTFPRAAAVAEIGWAAPDRTNWADFQARLPTELARYRMLGIRYSGDVSGADTESHQPGPFERHASQDLKTCTGKLVLSLEDDAPVVGDRAVFLMDILNPCWILESAELSRASALQVAVGQVPFNFQLGNHRDPIPLNPPRTPAGELEVRVDGCHGDPIAVLPLAAAVDDDAVTVLPPVPLTSVPRVPEGRHDLCFQFTQHSLDPMWALDWVQLLE